MTFDFHWMLNLANASGFEPELAVLETAVLTVTPRRQVVLIRGTPRLLLRTRGVIIDAGDQLLRPKVYLLAGLT